MRTLVDDTVDGLSEEPDPDGARHLRSRYFHYKWGVKGALASLEIEGRTGAKSRAATSEMRSGEMAVMASLIKSPEMPSLFDKTQIPCGNDKQRTAS